MDMEDLERRFDGPIPLRLKDIVIYGSALKADMAEIEDLIVFYQREIKRLNRSAGRWAARGDHVMAMDNMITVQEYARELPGMSARLTKLKERVAT